MAWSSEDRRKFLRALDETESRLLVLYRYLLYFLIVSVTVLAVLFYRSVAKDAFRDFLRLFGGILYLTFLAWAVGQLFAIRNRKSRESSGWNAPSPGDPKIAINFAKDPDTGARRFSFQFGSGPPPSNDSAKTMRIGFSASSLADDDKLDDAALAQAEAYVTSGADFDTVSRLLNPRYKDWSSPQQQVYRAYLQGQIELRKTSVPQMNQASPSASESGVPPEVAPFSLLEAETHKQRQPFFTLSDHDFCSLLCDPDRSFPDGVFLLTTHEVAGRVAHPSAGWPTFAPLFFAKVGSRGLMRRWLPSHLRRFPLKYKTWLASAESINPKRDRLVESHLSKNERWANRLIGKAAPAQSLHLRGTGARLRGRRPTVSDEGEPKRMAPKSEWDGRRWP